MRRAWRWSRRRVGDGRQQRFLAAVLAIAEDGAADLGAVDAELVGAAGARPKRQQSGTAGGAVHHPEMGERLLALLVIDLHGLAIARAGPLGERQVDRAFRPRRHADDHGPVELLGLAVAERLGQPLRGLSGARDQQQAGRILVEPMDQPRPLLEAEAQRVEHAVDMPLGARTALHREAGRLVEGDHPVVAMDHQALDLSRVPVGDQRPRLGLGLRFGRRRGDAGRQAHGLPRLDPVLAFDPPAVDAHLTGAQQLLQRAVGEVGKMALEPAIQPQTRLVAGNRARLDPAAIFAHGAEPKGQAK